MVTATLRGDSRRPSPGPVTAASPRSPVSPRAGRNAGTAAPSVGLTAAGCAAWVAWLSPSPLRRRHGGDMRAPCQPQKRGDPPTHPSPPWLRWETPFSCRFLHRKEPSAARVLFTEASGCRGGVGGSRSRGPAPRCRGKRLRRGRAPGPQGTEVGDPNEAQRPGVRSGSPSRNHPDLPHTSRLQGASCASSRVLHGLDSPGPGPQRLGTRPELETG